jgi:hypothetical protein
MLPYQFQSALVCSIKFTVLIFSAADPDPLGSAFILVSWIRIQIRIRNADPELDPADQNQQKFSDFCFKSLKNAKKYQFPSLLGVAKDPWIRIRIRTDLHSFHQLDPDPY